MPVGVRERSTTSQIRYQRCRKGKWEKDTALLCLVEGEIATLNPSEGNGSNEGWSFGRTTVSGLFHLANSTRSCALPPRFPFFYRVPIAEPLCTPTPFPFLDRSMRENSHRDLNPFLDQCTSYMRGIGTNYIDYTPASLSVQFTPSVRSILSYNRHLRLL